MRSSARGIPLIVGEKTLFFCDTHMNVDPDAQEIAEMTLLAADAIRRFGTTPRAALLSHSNFGVSISGEMIPPTWRNTSSLVALMRSAWVIAR